jgi:hypothetical protein
VVDFALALPSRMKVLKGREKRVLAAIVRRHLPPAIAERRKHGLGYPKDLWASPPVAQFARQLLLDPNSGSPFPRPRLEKILAEWLRPGVRRSPVGSLVLLQSWWNEFMC